MSIKDFFNSARKLAGVSPRYEVFCGTLVAEKEVEGRKKPSVTLKKLLSFVCAQWRLEEGGGGVIVVTGDGPVRFGRLLWEFLFSVIFFFLS